MRRLLRFGTLLDVQPRRRRGPPRRLRLGTRYPRGRPRRGARPLPRLRIWHLCRMVNLCRSPRQSHVGEPLAPNAALLPQFPAHGTAPGGSSGANAFGEEDVVDVLEEVPDRLGRLPLQLVVRPRERGLRAPLVEARPGEARPASRPGRDLSAPPERRRLYNKSIHQLDPMRNVPHLLKARASLSSSSSSSYSSSL